MKNAKTAMFFLVLLVVLGCEDVRPHERNPDDELVNLSGEEFVSNIFNIVPDGTDGAEMYKIDFTISSQEKLSIIDVEVEENFFLLPFDHIDRVFEQIEKGRLGDPKYWVCCDGQCAGCDRPYECYKIIKKCVDDGGCATVCPKQGIWMPEEKILLID